ncbi:MAG: mechanosensitive ion channel domain-containing protein [Terriglobales bacterium]|jgi:small-conductance mechanosensitive channel
MKRIARTQVARAAEPRGFMVRKILLLLLIALSPCLAQRSAGDLYTQNAAQFLNQTVVWYRRVTMEREIASTPHDAVFVNDNARVGDQIVRLAFDFARSEAQVAETQANSGQQLSSTPSRYQALTEMSRKLDAQIQQSQREIESLQRQLDSATGRKRQDIQSALSETQSELQLFEARRNILHTMVEFVGSTTEGTESTGLTAQIEALSHSVPAALTSPSDATSRTEESNSAAAISPSKSEPAGLWGLIAGIVSGSRKIQDLDQDIQATNSLTQDCKQLQTPLVDQLRQMAKQGDAIATQPDADNRVILAQNKGELDHLTSQFKLISASFVPLSKQAILLDLYSRNLVSWRNAVKNQYVADLKNLVFRLLSLGLVLAIVWGVAEVWRRAIYRYVHETRRRYQMLLLRRIALWLAIGLIIAFSFASELGSLATFAGLLTAGVAVALQNVILSVAAYFFLIGKFGVRVGDRVQIAGISGEVVEIGLVRMYLMELGGNGRDVQPTGRVVAFSNSFVFQPMAGMFKQIPGTNFVWHEITLTLAPDSDYRSVEDRMIKAVDAAFAPYHDTLEQQRSLMERNLGSVSVGPLRPHTGLKLTPLGLEVRVSFPVQLHEATEIDDRVTREILKELDREPKLTIVGSDIPTIRQIAVVPQSKAS